MTWTAKQTEQLIALRRTGCSDAEIAKLTNKTRQQVKAKRLHLRRIGKHDGTPKRTKKMPRKISSAAEVIAYIEERSGKVTVDELQRELNLSKRRARAAIKRYLDIAARSQQRRWFYVFKGRRYLLPAIGVPSGGSFSYEVVA